MALLKTTCKKHSEERTVLFDVGVDGHEWQHRICHAKRVNARIAYILGELNLKKVIDHIGKNLCRNTVKVNK